MKDIHEQINITVEPRIRAIIRSNVRAGMKIADTPLEVADIQYALKAMSSHYNGARHKIGELETKIKRQKHKLTELDTTIKEMSTLLKENNIEYNGSENKEE